MESNEFVLCAMCQGSFHKDICEPLEDFAESGHGIVFCPKCLKNLNLDTFLIKLMKNRKLYNKVRAHIYQYLKEL